MSINFGTVLLATVAEFIIGAIWYMPIFGQAWRNIHGFEKLTKKQQDQAQKEMMPLLGVQLAVTFITTTVLAKFMILLPNYSLYNVALLAWIGFVVPIQVAAIIFGGTESKWIMQKAAIMASGSLLCLLAAAAILTNI